MLIFFNDIFSTLPIAHLSSASAEGHSAVLTKALQLIEGRLPEALSVMASSAASEASAIEKLLRCNAALELELERAMKAQTAAQVDAPLRLKCTKQKPRACFSLFWHFSENWNFLTSQDSAASNQEINVGWVDIVFVGNSPRGFLAGGSGSGGKPGCGSRHGREIFTGIQSGVS